MESIPPKVDRPNHRQQLGQTGEDFAAWLLEGKGYRIVERNWRTRYGEIDLIVRSPNDTLCFVEVRTTLSHEKGGALESLSRRKCSRIARQALMYLTEKRLDIPARIDVIVNEYRDDEWATLHFENAFERNGR